MGSLTVAMGASLAGCGADSAGNPRGPPWLGVAQTAQGILERLCGYASYHRAQERAEPARASHGIYSARHAHP